MQSSASMAVARGPHTLAIEDVLTFLSPPPKYVASLMPPPQRESTIIATREVPPASRKRLPNEDDDDVPSDAGRTDLGFAASTNTTCEHTVARRHFAMMARLCLHQLQSKMLHRTPTTRRCACLFGVVHVVCMFCAYVMFFARIQLLRVSHVNIVVVEPRFGLMALCLRQLQDLQKMYSARSDAHVCVLPARCTQVLF